MLTPLWHRRSLRLLWRAVALCAVTSAQAQIPVGILGSPTNTFDSTPVLLTSEWATRSNAIGFASADYTTPADLDAAAQAVDQAMVNEPLPQTSGYGSFRMARHNTAAGKLFMKPEGVGAAVLKTTLRNTSGASLDRLIVSYDFEWGVGPAESAPGLRAYFSLTGLSNTWLVIPEFSSVTNSGPLTAILSVGSWAPNTDMFLLWLDDNAMTNPEGINTIDNFSVRNGHIDPSPIYITNSPSSLIVAEHSPAVFNVVAGGVPLNYHWFSNNVPVPSNNLPSFVIPFAAFPSHNGAQVYVLVSNALGTVTSAVATLTVIQDSTPPVVVSALSQTDFTTVSISFSEPLQPATVDVANFAIYPTGGDPDVDYLLNTSIVLNNGTNVVLTTETRIPGTNYSLRIQDVRDNSSAQNLIDPNPTVIPFIRLQVYLVDFAVDNLWKYSTETNLFGTGWETPGYDDTGPAWLSGPAGLGLDASANGVPIRTTTAYSARSEPQFFRRHFTLPALTNGLVLAMRHVFEDGAVVYLNGQEAGRYNVGAGPLSAATRTIGSVTDPTPISAPVPLPLTNVHPGDNVIAVVVVQFGNTSPDMEMAVELMAEFPRYPTGPPVIIAQPTPFLSLIEGQAFTLSVAVDGALPLHCQWRKGGVAIPGETNLSFFIGSAQPSYSGSYVLVASNVFGSATSSVATVTVGDYLNPPQFIYALADTNLTNITLTITSGLGLDVASVEDVGHYNVYPVAGGTTLTILAAVLTNGTNILLTTTPRAQGQAYSITLSGVTDRSVARNPVAPTTRDVICNVVILAPDFTSQWRYDSSSNNLDGVAWPAIGFDDSSWPTGLAGFTTSNFLEITTNGFELRTTNMLAPVDGGPLTTYYRVPFQFPWSPHNARLEIVGVVDDGMVAYINGVEAGRLRMSNTSPVSFTNTASASSPEVMQSHPLESVVLTNLSALVPGANLLAIELHQVNALTSDAILSIQLVAGTTFTHVDPFIRASYNSVSNLVMITWGGGTLKYATNLLTGETLWFDMPGNPGSPYFFTPTPDGQRFFGVAPW